MAEVNIKVFSTAIEVLDLFAKTEPARSMPVYVIETERTLGLRPFMRQISVGLVIPKSRPSSRGLSFTRGEMSLDSGVEGAPLGAFLSVQELKRRLRGVRTTRRRGDTTPGEVIFDPYENAVLFLYEPGSFDPVSTRVRWTNDPSPPRLPVYSSASGAQNTISADTLNAIGAAGRKLAPIRPWSYQDGRWELQNSEGSTLRVATWPTNP